MKLLVVLIACLAALLNQRKDALSCDVQRVCDVCLMVDGDQLLSRECRGEA